MILPDLKPHEVVRISRERKGLSQEAAAKETGWRVRLWVEMEKGRVLPPLPIRSEIERVLGHPKANEWDLEVAA